MATAIAPPNYLLRNRVRG